MARVFDLMFDEWNERECARHGIRAEEILQTLDNTPVFLPNKQGRSATLVMIGPSFGGRMLTVPLAPIDERSGLWRPVTAWDSDADELHRYTRAGGKR